ncbi:MAG: polysaccharide biosynthesis/export family protein [Planctomycetaceae bacterium]
MISFRLQQPVPVFCVFTVALLVSGCHCVSNVKNAVPAYRLPCELAGESKECKVPLQLASLGQDKPVGHVVDIGDTLSIYVFGVFPPTDDGTPIVQRTAQVNQRYYPPHGSILRPSFGLPVTVEADGSIELPNIDRVEAAGLTIAELTRKLKDAYREKKIFEEGRERVTVTLLIPRVTRVTVIREDTPATPVSLVDPGVVDHIHRGSGEVIDLPAYENDVLHALGATGGLPGTDAAREVWVFRRAALNTATGLIPPDLEAIREDILAAGPGCDCGHDNVIRIPLAGCPGEPLSFDQSDVILYEGDVVFVPRRSEYFYTGGLLKGARIPLPRDEDIDVIEAIALATGSTGGPLGQSGQALAGGSPGHMVRPTRVIILRRMPDGRELPIRVDLGRAMEDERERILIQKDDVVMLHFKPYQAVANGALNLVSFPFTTLTGN